jgi:two-component system OmpR family sensor kinase
MKPIHFMAILLPALLGALASAAAQFLFSPVPVLVFKIDIGMTIFLLGLFLTFLGSALGLGIFLREIRALAELDSLRRAQEDGRRQFIRRLDHELKNPLTGLRAHLVNVQEADGNQERAEAMDAARQTLDRLSRLMADLRKLSELETRPLEQLPVCIPEVLREMVQAAQSLPQYASRQVIVSAVELPWPLPPVTGDRDLLGLAFYNLIENALKFSRHEDPVEARAREDGKSLVVEVADSGPGISGAEESNIFDELYRGENARGVDGSGLGLAFVRRVVVLHGGEVSVRSRLDGARGTVFTVRLPLPERRKP